MENGPTHPQPSQAPGADAPTAATAPPRAETGVGDVHLLDYVKVLYKRRWTVGTVFLFIVLIATVYAFTAVPIYEARARLLIEFDSQNVVAFQQVIEERQSSMTHYYETQYQLLASRSLARRTLDTLELWNDPTFLGVTDADSFSVRRALSGAVETGASRAVGRLRPALDPPEDLWDGDAEPFASSQAIDTFLAGFAFAPVRNSRLVDITFRSPHPKLATEIINAHAHNYIDQNLEFRFLASQDASTWLGEQLAEQRHLVEESEAALHAYRQQNNAISLGEGEDIVVQRLSELNAALTRAKTDRIAKEVEFRQLETIQDNAEALDAVPVIVSNRFIQELKVELAGLRRQRVELADNLGDRHPDMIRIQSAVRVAKARLQVEIGKVVQSVRNEFRAAQAQERSLARELEAQKVKALAMNKMGIGYGVLLRDAESNRQVYESLLNRAKEISVSAELRSSNVRSIDEAELPTAPVSPRKSRILLIALLVGAMSGIGLAFFFEYLDDRIKTPEDLKAHLGLPSLGLIPAVSRKTLKTMHTPLINNGVPASFAEAFRTFRTGVMFSTADRTRLFLITSTGPGEGKSVVTSNLGIGLAQTKMRVLLIDADLRRPVLHQAFGLDQEPGLSNLLVGDAKVSDVLRKTAVPDLWLLTAGRIPPNPTELLGSQRFADFLTALSKQFDWILIDSPPVMAVTDAALVAHMTTGVIFVVGAEMTSRHAARQAVDHLESAHAKFTGAVLNRVELERNAYYYSQYYRSQYQQYYTQIPESAASTRARTSTLQL